ncbi:hypothetical protein L1049_001947 [Liquidambar formosana]|uniref:J domain-containing protein n=1 Tax=Liquidambar formosana TaxID=63359 RepID=A0AAP0NG63_LIQFO
MQIPRWRNVLILRNSLSQSSSSTFQFASFHSTPTSCEKWKNKWNSEFGRGQQPSKSYIKYATRQKRADTKKALKDLLFHSGSSKFSFQDEERVWKIDGTNSWDAEQEADSSEKKGRSKCSARRAGKANYKKLRRKLRKEYFSEDCDEHPERIFQATLGNRWFTWSFRSQEDSSFRSSTTGFEWREHSNYTNNKKKEWETTSETESDYESCVVGSYSDRTILGLPPRGPLKIEDVKNAFRSSALKWHPDKHQGPSQATAEEKFKLCVDAYKSLCSALSAV